MDDSSLVELYWRRSESAVAESERAYGGYCFSIAFSVLSNREDSEECVSDTWLRAWNAIPPQRPRRLSAFFGRITRNLALDRYAAKRASKRGGGETELVLEELVGSISSPDTPESAVDDAELAECVNRFLRALPPRERNVFLCRYWYITPIKDIAAKYGMSVGAVKATLHRSREKLRKHLEKEGADL